MKYEVSLLRQLGAMDRELGVSLKQDVRAENPKKALCKVLKIDENKVKILKVNENMAHYRVIGYGLKRKTTNYYYVENKNN